MLEKLKEVEAALPELLKDYSGWKSLLVDYDKPHVHRLWRQFDNEHRVLLHKIFPCGEDVEPLMHPHPWPSAIKIFIPGFTKGYRTAVAWGSRDEPHPPEPARFMLQSGSTYEMTHPMAWHYVEPVGGPIYSVMVTGKPYDEPKQDRFGQGREHRKLCAEFKEDLFIFFRSRYLGWKGPSTPKAEPLELVDIAVRRADGKFLAVTNRKHDGWTLPGGKIDPGERPGTAALRELEEETGLKIQMRDLSFVGTFTHRWRGIPCKCYGYVAREEGWKGQEPTNVEEGTKVFWVDRDDLLDPESGCLAESYYGWLSGKMGW